MRDVCAEAAVSIQFQLRIHSLVLLGLSSLLLGPVRGVVGVRRGGECKHLTCVLTRVKI